MPTRITLNTVLSLCLVLLSLSITICAQIEAKTMLPFRDNSEIVSQDNSDQEKPQDFKFHNADFKDVLNTLGSSLKLDIVFDHQVRSDDKVNIELHDVTVEKAMKMILIQKRYQARIIEDNRVIVFQDDQYSRKRYEKYKPWPANAIRAQSRSLTDSSKVQDIRFKTAWAKGALHTLGSSAGLNVVFDDTVAESLKVTIELKDVTMESAVEIVLIQQNLAAKLIDDKTIIVFPDIPSIRQRFVEYEQWPEKREIDFTQEASGSEVSPEETQRFAFQDEGFDAVMSTLGKRLNLNIVFHSQVKTDDKVTIDLHNVTTGQAIENILNQKKCQARLVEQTTIMLFNDDDVTDHRYREHKRWSPIRGEQR